MFLEIPQISQENTCARVSILMACNFIEIETLAQVFSCEFCEISKDTFFTEYVWATASMKHTQDGYILFALFYFQVACNCSINILIITSQSNEKNTNLIII